jgi:small conductance mechanosensitive channel
MRVIAVLLTSLLCGVALTPATAQIPQLQAPAEDTDNGDADVETLIRLLEDDAARERLIEQLRAAQAADGEQRERQTFAGRLAIYTRSATAGAVAAFAAMSELVRQGRGVLSGAVDVDVDALQSLLVRVGALMGAVFGLYLLLQIAFRSAQQRLAARAGQADTVGRAEAITFSAGLDVATVLLAWGAGYGVALGLGRQGETAIEQSLFLNAFLIIELGKAGARSLLAPRWPALRAIRIEDTNAAYWYFWLSRVVSLIGYTFLFIAPLVAASVSGDLAEAIRAAVLLTALVIGIAIVLQNRDAVRLRLLQRASGETPRAFARSLTTFARVWHVVAIAYLVAVFVLWAADPETALPFVLRATVQSAVAILLGVLLSAFVARLASGGMRLDDEVKARLPLLEARLNAFIPNVLRVMRVIVMVAVIVAIVHVWRVADVAAWVASDFGQRVISSLISVALILLIGSVVYVVVQSWIEYRLNPLSGAVTTARERTLLALFRNAFTVVIGVLVFMLVLSELGVNIGPLLAGAGVVGLAIGFGAQKLVQDVINGAFIQFEDTLNEGDVVTAGGVSGVVERLTIRSVSLRSLDGAYPVIPFSSVDTVTNLVKHFSFHVAAIGVAYRENIAEVKQAMRDAFEQLKQTEFGADIIEDFEMQGITEFADSAVIVRARIKTQPAKQWAVGRAYNEILKQVFDERGIEIPFPHLTLYAGENKDGSAPALRVQSLGAQKTD